MVRVSVLGSVEAIGDDGQLLAVGGAQVARVMAALALEPSRPVSSARLIDILWGDAPQNGSHGTLQTYVWRLRRVLGRDAVLWSSAGYALSVDVVVDAVVFERGVAGARSADPVGAVERFDEALSLWRGPAFGGFASEWWAKPAADRLDGSRLSVRSERIDALLAAGRVKEAAADSETLVADAPLREEFARQRMLALHGCGRSVDALRCGEAFRRRLGVETGMIPSPDLAALERRLLEHDPVLSPSEGRSWRGYELGRLIAEGAYGAVYEATQPSLGREVAVKVLRRDRADAPDFVLRFEAEAQLVARLEHSAIVPLYDFWREPGAAFLVFRLMRGGTLAQRLAGPESIGVADVDVIVDRIGAALTAAHRAGVAHRDVRAANVLYDEDGYPYLADFGIAVEDQTAVADDVLAFAGLIEAALDRAGHPDDQPVRSVLRRASIGELVSAADVAAAWREARGATPRSPSPDATRTPRRGLVPVVNPYKGLRPFVEADRAEFFGRSELIDEVCARLAVQRWVCVVGASGSGKSSLVLAGVVPRLRDEGRVVTSMVPGARPLWSLSVALQRVATESQVARADDDPAALLLAVATAGPVLLVVDQLEELWTVSVPEDRLAFTEAVVAAVDAQGSRLLVVSTVRADFLDRPLGDPTLGPLTRQGTVLVGPLAPAELESAITGPLAGTGVGVEDGLVSRMIAEVADRPGALPLLQFVLAVLFDRRVDGRLTVPAFDELGGVVGALASQAEELFRTLTPADQDATRRLFGRLVTPGDAGTDTRHRASRDELPDIPEGVLAAFDRARLLTFDRDPATGAPTVELAHEALLLHWPRVRRWVAEDRGEILARRALREASAAWLAAERDPSHLYRGSRLEGAAALESGSLGDNERAFLEASETERGRTDQDTRRRLRRSQALLATTATLLVLAMIAGAVALRQRQLAQHRAAASAASAQVAEASSVEAESSSVEAEASRVEAEASRVDAQLRRVAFESSSVADAQPDLGLLLAAEAAQRRPGAESASALMTALQANPAIDRVIDLGIGDDHVSDLGGTAPGPLVATTTSEAIVLDGSTLLPTGVRWPLDAVANAAVAPDGTEAATASRSGRVERHDLVTGALIGDALAVEPGAIHGRGLPVAYVGDGDLAVADDHTVNVYRRGEPEPEPLLVFDNRVGLLVASPDGRRLLVGEDTTDFAPRTEVIDLQAGVRHDLSGLPVIDASFDAQSRWLVTVDLSPSLLSSVTRYDATSFAVEARSAPLIFGARVAVLDSGEVLVLDLGSTVSLVSAEDTQPGKVLDTNGQILTAVADRALVALGSGLVVVDPSGTVPLVEQLAIKGIPRLSADAQLLFVFGADGGQLFDSDNLEAIGPLIPELVVFAGNQAGLSPDGALAAAGSIGQVRLFDTRRGTPMGSVPAAGVGVPTFSPDGSLLAVDAGGRVDIYEVPGLRLRARIPVDSTLGTHIAWSPDGTQLIFTDITTGGHLVDMAAGTVEPIAHWGDYSSDGAALALFVPGEPVRVRDRRSGTDSVLAGTRSVALGRFVRGNQWLFRATAAGYWDVLDIASGARVGRPIPVPGSAIAAQGSGIAVPPGGDHVLVGLSDTPVLRIELDPARWEELACEVAGRNLTRTEWETYFGDIAGYDVTCAQYPAGV